MPLDTVIAGRPILADWGNDASAAIAALEAADTALDGRLDALEATLTRWRWLGAREAELDGSALVTIGAVPDAVRAVQLADGATQGAYWALAVPEDWASGNFTVQPWWAPAVADAVAHTVRWSVSAKVRGSAGNLSSAGTATPWTGASAAHGTAHLLSFDTAQDTGVAGAANGILAISLRRIGADAADTFVGAINLLGVRLSYTGKRP